MPVRPEAPQPARGSRCSGCACPCGQKTGTGVCNRRVGAVIPTALPLQTLAASLTPNLCCVGTEVALAPHVPTLRAAGTCAMLHLWAEPEGLGGAWRAGTQPPLSTIASHCLKQPNFSAFPLHEMKV